MFQATKISPANQVIQDILRNTWPYINMNGYLNHIYNLEQLYVEMFFFNF